MIITHADMMSCGYCNKGARAFAKRHNLNWEAFVNRGIDESILSQIDDEMVKRVIEHTRLRRNEVSNGR